MQRTIIIAEAGVNHNGDIEQALKLVDAASDAGADFVKFQTFRAEKIVTLDAPKADYQKKTTSTSKSQFEMLKKLELTLDDHHTIKSHCKKREIGFLSTPFDSDSVDFLVNKMNLKLLKVPSGEITNGPLLLHVARTGCKVILSTGMSTMADIEMALRILAFGYIEDSETPDFEKTLISYASSEGQQSLRENVTLLHCTTEYPAPFNEINLRVIGTLKNTFSLPVGYSDHSVGIEVSIAAVALGATIIEKHFTLDRNLPGPDHKASLEPHELQNMVSTIRNIEIAMGNPEKIPTASELKNRKIARKSIVASKSIVQGEYFTPENITTKRPGEGISPINYWSLLDTKASVNFEIDEKVTQ
jgi:N-acetylneuraminate synthase